MMPFIHTRSKCDACRLQIATIERRRVWLCASCDSSITEFSFAPASVSRPGVNVTAAASAPSPSAAVTSFRASRRGSQAAAESSNPDLKLSAAATNSDPACLPKALLPRPDTAGASALAFSSIDPGACGFEFAEFPDFAFRKYANTFRVVASSEIVPTSSA